MPVAIEITGIEETIARLDRATADTTLRPVMQRATDIIESTISPYPPPPPRSTYRRTGRLGRGWRKQTTGSGGNLQGIVENVGVPYAPYVQAASRQAWMHRGRWQTDEQVAKEVTPRIIAAAEDAVQKAFG